MFWILTLIAICLIISWKALSQSTLVINEKKVHVRMKGNGDPAVIFINGLGTDLRSFGRIQQRIARGTFTVSYDRPGTGRSEPVDSERSIDVLASELHELITKLGLKEKYILAGHSMGAYIMRFYCVKYPGEVAGLFFIDPSHEDFYDRKLALRTPEAQAELRKRSFDFPESAPRTIRNEFLHFMTTDVELVKNCRIPSDIPVTILTAIRITKKEKAVPYKEKDVDTWRNLHREWTKNAPNIRHVETPNSGHSIHHDEPDLVVRELEALIRAVKHNKGSS